MKRYYLKIAAQGTLAGLVEREMWRDIGAGILACVRLAVRLLILITFPVSTPLIAWLIMVCERRFGEQEADLRARMRRGIHQNGPGT